MKFAKCSQQCSPGSCTDCILFWLVQLAQLDQESLQHTQQRAERFQRKGHQVSRFTDRAERDPFADATASDKYANLESASEDEGEDAGMTTLPSISC